MLEAVFGVDETWVAVLVQALWVLTTFCGVAAVVAVASLLTASADDLRAEKMLLEGHQLGVGKPRVREMAAVH